MALKTGLQRIAKAIWWLSWGLIALGAAIATSLWVASRDAHPSEELLYALMFWIPGGLGLLLSWIVEGFANKEA